MTKNSKFKRGSNILLSQQLGHCGQAKACVLRFASYQQIGSGAGLLPAGSPKAVNAFLCQTERVIVALRSATVLGLLLFLLLFARLLPLQLAQLLEKFGPFNLYSTEQAAFQVRRKLPVGEETVNGEVP